MKKVFSFVVILAAVVMVSCAGNANNAAATEATEVVATEVVAVEACDSTKCAEACDSTKTCCEQAEAAAPATK